MASDDWQDKGILLASISQEMLTGDAEVLKMDDKKVIATETCKFVYDALKTSALLVEKLMVLVRTHAFCALRCCKIARVIEPTTSLDQSELKTWFHFKLLLCYL